MLNRSNLEIKEPQWKDEICEIAGIGAGAAVFMQLTAKAQGKTFNKKVHAFFLGIGSREGRRMQTLSDGLTKTGIHNTYLVSPGTAHEKK